MLLSIVYYSKSSLLIPNIVQLDNAQLSLTYKSKKGGEARDTYLISPKPKPKISKKDIKLTTNHSNH